MRLLSSSFVLVVTLFKVPIMLNVYLIYNYNIVISSPLSIDIDTIDCQLRLLFVPLNIAYISVTFETFQLEKLDTNNVA